jgi:hypothetical protein
MTTFELLSCHDSGKADGCNCGSCTDISACESAISLRDDALGDDDIAAVGTSRVAYDIAAIGDALLRVLNNEPTSRMQECILLGVPAHWCLGVEDCASCAVAESL